MDNRHQKNSQNELSLENGKLYSFSQLCELLQISRQTVYNWIEEEILKPKKIRGRVYFLGEDIIQLLNDSAV
jgi:predicted DNA-binding transcriptional regulator AlpA